MPFISIIKHNCFARPLVYILVVRVKKFFTKILLSEVVQVSEVRFLYQKEIERPGKREKMRTKGEGEGEGGGEGEL